MTDENQGQNGGAAAPAGAGAAEGETAQRSRHACRS